MFSIPPSNLNLRNDINSVTVGDVTGSTKLLVPGRATAATNIPQGAITSPIEPELLRGRSDVVQITVGANTSGIIELTDASKQVWCKDIHWVRALRLSDDCHSYNIQLKLQPSLNKKINSSKLILHAIKPIAAGQELLLWFSEEILAMVQMVFLTPANIQGQKKYVCTRCSTLYESPNPLKLHIVLGCGKQTILDFWDKLAALLKENITSNCKNSTGFMFKLTTPEVFVNKQKIAIDLSSPHQPSNSSSPSPISAEIPKIFYRPYTEPPSIRNSAFKPFQKIELDAENQAQPPFMLQNLPNTQLAWPNLAFNQNFFSQNYLHTNTAAFNDEAQIETLMSSLGKSKEGHICLYCGKCYSRKYGLKIHIRTHTGYKPLKCKFCMRPFGDPSNLNKHVRLHAEGETPYKCELCGKILVRRRDLERHLKSRHMCDILPGRGIVEESNTSDITDDDVEESDVNR